ncbi:hypothetical protein HZB02_01230 [Candidatus Woesearchaeota archaeon]|nr:hypothetical protein [Candidatus Woesearchaeota archaeon]
MAGTAKWGVWAFTIGLVLSVILAFVYAAKTPDVWAIWVLAVLGVAVGLLNVTDSEVQLFLVAAIGFLLSFQSLNSVFTALGWVAVGAFFNLVSVFMAPAAAVVAVKALYNLAKD